MMKAKRCVRSMAAAALVALMAAAGEGADDFVSLFNGRDLSGWKIPAGDNGHWRVIDGVIDYDAESEASGDKSLWSAQEFGDFVLRTEWRIKSTPYVNPSVPIIRFDGTHKTDAAGKEIRIAVPDSHRRVNAPRRPRRRDAEAQRRSRHRRLEQLRDHDARQPADGRAQWRGSHQPGGVARCRAAGTHRLAAPW
jgi:3-keto-disaccharide hydrolase